MAQNNFKEFPEELVNLWNQLAKTKEEQIWSSISNKSDEEKIAFLLDSIKQLYIQKEKEKFKEAIAMHGKFNDLENQLKDARERIIRLQTPKNNL